MEAGNRRLRPPRILYTGKDRHSSAITNENMVFMQLPASLLPGSILLTVLLCPLWAPADLVKLKSGGQIEGHVIHDQGRPEHFVIETPAHGRIVVNRQQVVRVVQQTDADREYSQRAHQIADTPEAHWELAEWCRENQLSEQAEQHLQRVLELDPQNPQARQRLGFQAIGGTWMNREELMASRGLLIYQGKYRTQQEIELLERAEKRDSTAAQWRGRVQRWYRQLFDRHRDKALEAQKNLAAIRDPLAADAVAKLLKHEENVQVKLMLLEVLSQIPHQTTINVLVNHVLYDPLEEVRVQSLEYLIDSTHPGTSSSFVRALQSQENLVVNRAALALQEIGDPSTIYPLIDALVTEHKFVLGAGPSGGDRYEFSPSSGAFSFGSSGPRIEKRLLKNPSVLSALVILSDGKSFDYDQPRWHTWLAAQQTSTRVDMRRDD